jgi:hypothetical protein
MAQRSRTRATSQLLLEWTDALRWDDLPSEVRDELRDRLSELLVQVVAGERRAEDLVDE